MTKAKSESDELEPAELGRRLREAREYLGLSQEQVADYLGIPRPSVSTIEAGKRRVSFQEIKRLAALYRRPLSSFSDEETPVADETADALFRTTQELSSTDREQVLRFAQFLRTAGPAKPPTRNPAKS